MVKLEVKDGKLLDALRDFFRRLLAEKAVDALLVPQEIPSGESVAQTLVSDPEALERVNPLAPVMLVNSARLVSQLTMKDSGKKIACVLRPCEARAAIELIKLKQITAGNLILIGIDCWGTYSVTGYAEKAKAADKGGTVTEEFLGLAKGGQDIPNLRNACQICRFPTAKNTDLSINLIGVDLDKEIVIQALTDKGKKVLESLKLEETAENPKREEKLTKLLEKRKEKAGKEDENDFLALFSSICINCQNCRAVCPVCYCKQCVFEGPIFDFDGRKYISWAKKRNTLKMPVDTYLFQLTRMSHIASSCVACGLCEAACPSNIPLGKIYPRLSAKVQESLGYEAGRSLEEELPLSTFKEDELQTVEE